MNLNFFLHEMSLMHVLWMSHRYLKQIMLICKERENDFNDSQETNYPNMVMSSRECGVFKYFRVLDMRSHVRLLDHLTRMWDLEKQHFQVVTHILTIYVEDIYFLTKISRRGSLVSFSGPQGGEMAIDGLINEHNIIGSRSQCEKIPIKNIMDRPLRTVEFTIEKVVGSKDSH